MLEFIKNIFSKKQNVQSDNLPEYSVVDAESGDVVTKQADISVCYALDAETERKLGNNENALANIKKAIELKPDNDMYYYTQALIFQALGNNEEYISSIRKAHELNPEYKKYSVLIESFNC